MLPCNTYFAVPYIGPSGFERFRCRKYGEIHLLSLSGSEEETIENTSFWLFLVLLTISTTFGEITSVSTFSSPLPLPPQCRARIGRLRLFYLHSIVVFLPSAVIHQLCSLRSNGRVSMCPGVTLLYRNLVMLPCR